MSELNDSVNSHQVGGDHYRAEIQHWDFVELNGLGYLEGVATKYATRNRKKYESPKTDWEKAKHYVEKLQALYAQETRRNRRAGPLVVPVEDFARANDLKDHEHLFVRYLTNWRSAADLQAAWAIAHREASRDDGES